jgi:hypothetical protein
VATLPFLLKDLSPDQRVRILALDYITGNGFVPPDEWLNLAAQVEVFIKVGSLPILDASVHEFPTPIS